MFSQETLLISIDQQQLESGSTSKFAELLNRLSYLPDTARAKRSAFVLSFEKAGVKHLVNDARARRFVANLAQAVPHIGYFLNGNPPFFHLRDFSLALSYSIAEELTPKSFLKTHERLYNDAVQFCPSVGDVEDVLEEIFVVNLIPEVLQTDPLLQSRAMHALYETLLTVQAASPPLRKRTFAEAERIWGRSLSEFESPEQFLREFQTTFRSNLKSD